MICAILMTLIFLLDAVLLVLIVKREINKFRGGQPSVWRFLHRHFGTICFGRKRCARRARRRGVRE